MTSQILSVLCGGGGARPEGVIIYDNSDNKVSPCQAYEHLQRISLTDVGIYIHDDVTIHDPEWMSKVMAIFLDNDDCVAVGLGGATGLANHDLYRKPFNIWNMARRGYRSNQTDWKTHGEHCDTLCRVAVLDAFFMAVRRDFLVDVGGWPTQHLTHHCLDLWLACEAARQGKEIWMAGVSCTHHGGGSSTKPGYAQARWLQGGSLELDHLLPHKWLYEEYRDVLPLEAIK